MTRKCFVCEKNLKRCEGVKDDALAPVDDATIWETSGNFGSTVFDPMNSTTLQIYICDKCLAVKCGLANTFDKAVYCKVSRARPFEV